VRSLELISVFILELPNQDGLRKRHSTNTIFSSLNIDLASNVLGQSSLGLALKDTLDIGLNLRHMGWSTKHDNIVCPHQEQYQTTINPLEKHARLSLRPSILLAFYHTLNKCLVEALRSLLSTIDWHIHKQYIISTVE
jgi:hypothetical protein